MEAYKLSEYKDYDGVDVSNEISLFEYGLLIKPQDDGFYCVYRYGEQFSAGWIGEKDIDEYLSGISNSVSFLSWTGISTVAEWKDRPNVGKLYELLQ